MADRGRPQERTQRRRCPPDGENSTHAGLAQADRATASGLPVQGFVDESCSHRDLDSNTYTLGAVVVDPADLGNAPFSGGRAALTRSDEDALDNEDALEKQISVAADGSHGGARVGSGQALGRDPHGAGCSWRAAPSQVLGAGVPSL